MRLVFTERTVQVISQAQEEAGRMGQVDTEHLLLSLLKERKGAAAWILDKIGINRAEARAALESMIQPQPSLSLLGKKYKLTSRAHQVLEWAEDEARQVGVPFIGDDHLLLGLLHEEGSIVAQVLAQFGLDLEKMRQQVTELHRS
jgi:ATP-dependent Clp protease ATP-binding subunit ClpC